MAPTDYDLQILLDLATARQEIKAGWWFKIEARRVSPPGQVPDDIRYSLTLHDPDNNRVLGFDNDHQYHHRHRPDGSVTNYTFSTCGDLATAFFDVVDTYLTGINVLP